MLFIRFHTSHALLLHGIFEFLGVFIAYRYYLRLKKTQGDIISNEHRIYVVTAAAIGAVAGSRIIGSLEDLPAWLSAASRLSYFSGNKTLVGGLLGGLCSVELAKKIMGEKQRTGDLFTLPLIAGIVIGRIGCFLAGLGEQTYGYPSGLPWAIDMGDGIPRHPVTLYEIFFLLLLFFLIRALRLHYSFVQGGQFRLFLISYLLFRLLLDFIKPGWRFFLGLGTIQLTCIAGLAYYLDSIVHWRTHIAVKKSDAG